ncbi:hypothetical protein BpHYR1_021798 [Brachionus plicatilis]|uniref:Uncharacterized protein n=1 Tax=Brachionus plicatilis TaxID=10195 RepID=A0A3M7QX36_BRAPC|nr:hypothetical protein BpHYR1_021798 [Brachionus plicatilis]
MSDEVIESASQVSGPRKIEPYEAQTSRVDKQENGENGNQTILAWVLKNKLKSEIKTVDLKSESTLVGSKAARNEASPKPAPRQPSASSVRNKSNGSIFSTARSDNNNSSKQQWRINSQSSNSDLSGLKK